MTRRLTAAASWLSLAAAPTLAAAALVTWALEAQPGSPVCSTAPMGSPFSAMSAMYLLMGAFHLGPWLRLGAERGGDRINEESLACRRLTG